MLKLLTLNNIGDAGINSDLLPWELGKDNITDGLNFRVRDGFLMPLGGSTHVYDAPINKGTAGVLAHVRIFSGDFWAQCTTDYVTGTAGDPGWYDLNPVPFELFGGDEAFWTVCQLGQNLVFNHPDIGPGMATQDSAFLISPPFNAEQTWREYGLACRAMRSHKNFLIAMNLIGAENEPNGYRISTAADTNGIPYTWDETDRGGIAIKASLGGDGAEILDGGTLRDEFCMYSRESIDLLNFNANSPFYWTRRSLSSTIGLLSTNCITEVKGTHFFIADGDIVSNDGTTLQSIMHKRLLKRFNARTNRDTILNSFTCRNDIKKEVWFCIPEGESVTPNIAYVYNWKDNSWSLRDLPENLVFADYGKNPISETIDPESRGTWALIQGTWDSQLIPWGSDKQISALDDALVGLLSTGELVNLDPEGDIQEDDLNTFLERVDYPLEGQRRTCTVSRIYPYAEGGEFTMQIGSQQQTGGPVAWEVAKIFDPGVDRKIDVRTTGESFAWRVNSIGKKRFKLSGMGIEYSVGGTR